MKNSPIYEEASAAWTAGVPLQEFLRRKKGLHVDEVREITYIYSMMESCLRVWCQKHLLPVKGGV